MAAILSNTKLNCHVRSISLPSLSGQEPEFINLNRIQDSKEASTSAPLMRGRLSQLNDMYGSIEPWLALPATKSTSCVQRCNKEQLNKSLDEIVGLLDLCTTTKDVLSMSMDASKELQSVLRRKRGDHQNLISLFKEYLSQRKNVKKIVCKALSGLEKQTSSSNKEDNKITSDFNILKEMRFETLTMFESLLTFFLGSETELKQKGWIFFSKMVGYKRVQCDQKHEESEVKKVDDVLRTIISFKNLKSGSLEVDTIQTGLANLELQLLDLDQQVDRLSRNLIRNRVSILNFLNF
uniref:uncharacterized protein LOC122596910 n=1 Tax=Erigeron canadensis TaxID=72917 RepID=UPI001CB9167B|nr:uncharacterized protein LOC122596910 [Erigeron canadensis]